MFPVNAEMQPKKTESICPSLDPGDVPRQCSNAADGEHMSEPSLDIDNEPMTPKQAAAYLKTPVRTLADWRLKGIGPQFARCGGRHVRYRKKWLDQWLDAQAVTSTAEAKRISQMRSSSLGSSG